MSIKFTHDHEDGGACYKIYDRYGGSLLTEPGIAHLPVESRLDANWPEAQPVGVQFCAYSGSWHIYDVTTGREIGSVTREFYDRFIKPHRHGNLGPAPECVQK